MQKSNIIKSIILFVISISILLIFRSFITNISNNYLISTSHLFLQKYVNEKYIFKKDASSFIDNNKDLNVECIFYGTKEGDIQRQVNINTFQEFVLPFIILLSFSIATCIYFKSKILFLLASLVTGINIFTMKILIMIFDNYNYADYKLSEFIFPIDEIVYFSNLLLNTTGTSINFVLPVLIILILFALFTPKDKLIFTQ